MIIPPVIGQEVVRKATETSDDKGYVPARNTYQAATSPCPDRPDRSAAARTAGRTNRVRED